MELVFLHDVLVDWKIYSKVLLLGIMYRYVFKRFSKPEDVCSAIKNLMIIIFRFLQPLKSRNNDDVASVCGWLNSGLEIDNYSHKYFLTKCDFKIS